MKDVLGIDFGNTIVRRVAAGEKHLFLSEGEMFQQDNAYNCIIRLISERFGADNVHLISKVSETGEARVREWLRANDFFLTGFNMDNLHFCRERRDKGEICKRLGVTHMIDDRPEVMVSCSGIVRWKYLFRPSPRDVDQFKAELLQMTGLKTVTSWWDVEREFFGSLKAWHKPSIEELVGGSRVEITIDGKVCLGVSMKQKITINDNKELLALIEQLREAATH